MPQYRRWYQPGGLYFFTAVTCQRQPLFQHPSARSLLGSVMRGVSQERPFTTFAIVLLWDHLHCIGSLPPGDDDFSSRWRNIKARFSRDWTRQGGNERPVSESQGRHGHRGVWQRRFWERLIRDEDELEQIADYIHYNPVKHGYVTRPGDWPWSSFPKFVRLGHYPEDWGRTEPDRIAGLEYE